MTSAERSFLLKRALLRALADCAGFPALDTAIREAALIKIDYLRPTTAELDAQFAAIDTERLAVALETPRGRKLQLTDAGSLWLAANQ